MQEKNVFCVFLFELLCRKYITTSRVWYSYYVIESRGVVLYGIRALSHIWESCVK